jgi:peptidyl-prolyl cis-trans isomerase D
LVYPTLDATQLAVMTATITPTTAPSFTPRPTLTPDLSATPTLVPSFTPTTTPYTLKGYQTSYEKTLKQYSPDGMTEAEFRKIYYENGLFQDRVKAKVTADVAHEQEQVWARHILVADEATANIVQAGLLSGQDFATLAAKYSVDTSTKDKGGDMGWQSKGAMTPELEAAAFSMNIGDISKPIKDTFGYHIIQVLGHEVRPLTDTQYQTAVTNAFNKWLTAQRTNAKIVINSSWTNYVPNSPTLAEAMAKDAATQTAYVATYQAQNSTK